MKQVQHIWVLLANGTPRVAEATAAATLLQDWCARSAHFALPYWCIVVLFLYCCVVVLLHPCAGMQNTMIGCHNI
jgi:hypothetical protein